MQTIIRVAVCATLLLPGAQALLADTVEAESTGEPQEIRRAQRMTPVTPFAINVDLRTLPAPREWKPGDPIREIPRRLYLPPGITMPSPIESRDPLLDKQMSYTSSSNLQRGTTTFETPSRNFAGTSFTGAGVPDTVGDVGANYIIEAVNGGGGTTVNIWDKAEPTPALQAVFTLDSLGTGSCANGLGDPVVIYDRNAERWVIMEFVSGGTNLCVYVSQTSDPVTGGWYAYNFVPPSFPDYPKLSVWPTDANGGGGSYVVTANAGSAAYTMERGPMLLGQSAEFLVFDLPNLPGFGFQASTPADIDGPMLPPSTAPAVLMRHRDTEVHAGPAAPGDLLEMWHLDIDWQNTGNSALIQLASIDVADFSSELCGLTAFACFQQPNSGITLDPLREVIMHRLQYIHHEDGFETLVGNFVIDVSGTDQGGIRWFEVRRTGGEAGAWTLYQEGTYSIDTDNRWMGASSMDQSGNIAVAYNVSSTTTFPSLRYTGRKFDDPLGVMTATETNIAAGSSPSGTNRYGDYAAMGLDPFDDCTFWFVGEYNVSTAWSTRWASFRYDACGCVLEPSAPLLGAVENGDNQIDLTWNDSDLDEVVHYEVLRARLEGGPYETIAMVSDTSPGVAGGPGYVYEDLDVSGGTTYWYVVIATDGGPCKSDPVNEAFALAEGDCVLRPIFDGAASAQIDIDDTCGINVSWNPATPECGSSVLYNLYRSTDPAFVPGPSNLLAGGITGTSVLDQSALTSGADYHYLVRALDERNFFEDLNDVKVSAIAGGSGGQETIFFEDFENSADFDDWTVTTGPGFHRCGEWDLTNTSLERPSNGSDQYIMAKSEDCHPLLPATSASVDSPPLDLSSPTLAAVVLDFDIYYNHQSGDDSTVEVWDGSQWVVIWSDSNEDFDGSLSFDVSAWALGNSAFQVRFNYQKANADRWFSVDNVRIGVDVICSTAASPDPAPDGEGGTTPLHGERLTVSGDQIQVTWDGSSCGTADYNLLYGDLANVASYSLLGSECSIGTGSFNWNSVPAGSLFFLVVGEDGVDTESSWGLSSYGERNGLTPSGECSVDSKTVAGTCP